MTIEELEQNLVATIEKVITLQIVTVVGQYDNAGKVPTTGSKMMRTQLNLVQGDKITEMDPDFVNGPLAVLRDYHAASEKAGHEIIATNVATLISYLKLLRNFRAAK